MRGQTLPLWFGATIFMITMSFFLYSYGDYVANQFRIQTAADSVANAAVARQSLDFNIMIEALYVNAVEEYRLRNLLEAIRITATHSGGCDLPGNQSSSMNNCNSVWQNLLMAYRRSLQRYDHDVHLLNHATEPLNTSTVYGNSKTLINAINNNCKDGSFYKGFDCGPTGHKFTYVVIGVKTRDIHREVKTDAINIYAPTALTVDPNQFPPTTSSGKNFDPIAVEIGVCTTFSQVNITKVVPNTKLYARGAATDAMVEQDWFEPGLNEKPGTNTPYQPEEIFGAPNAQDQQNWYSVSFGTLDFSNNTSSSKNAIVSAVDKEALIIRTGWWAPAPIFPFSSPSTATNALTTGACG